MLLSTTNNQFGEAVINVTENNKKSIENLKIKNDNRQIFRVKENRPLYPFLINKLRFTHGARCAPFKISKTLLNFHFV